MHMKKLKLIFILLISVNVSAQTKLITIEEAIATALQNNFDIQLSKNDSMVSALDYSYRNAIFFPRINATIGANWTGNKQNQEFSNGTKREGKVKTNNLSSSVAVSWTLFDGLKMFATRDKAAELIKLGSLGIQNQVTNTIATVINTYYNIVRQKQMIKAIDEQMALSNERAKLAQYKLDIGVGTKPDVLQAKIDNNAQKALQIDQGATMRQLKEQLLQLLNLKAPASFDVSDSIPINSSLTIEEVQNDIEKSNPGLLIAQKGIDIAKYTLKERKAEQWPTVSFNSAYNFNRTNNNVALNPALPIFNQNKGLNYGLTASIPILNGLNTKRQIQQVKLNIRFQELALESQKSDLSLAVTNAYLEYEQQLQALELENDNILLAKENASIVFQVYKLNSTTLIQLKEAEKSLQDAFTRLITARYNAKMAETELLRLKGDLAK